MADYKAPKPKKNTAALFHWTIPVSVIIGAIVAQGGLHF